MLQILKMSCFRLELKKRMFFYYSHSWVCFLAHQRRKILRKFEFLSSFLSLSNLELAFFAWLRSLSPINIGNWIKSIKTVLQQFPRLKSILQVDWKLAIDLCIYCVTVLWVSPFFYFIGNYIWIGLHCTVKAILTPCSNHFKKEYFGSRTSIINTIALFVQM